MDQDDVSYREVVEQLTELYGKRIAPLHMPLRENGKFVGYINIVKNKGRRYIEKDKKELAGDFCRGCGYCMPCPAGIEINQCARMSLMLRRAPAAAWLTEEWQQKMHQIENCRHCGHCMSKCPYGLNTPELLQANYKDYWEVLAASKAEK